MSRSLIGIAVAGILAGNLATTVARADDVELTEIVVTAQRRSENVQDVPAAIQVFTPQQLAEFRIEQTGDLAAYTPGLYVSTSQFGDPVFSLRGVGMNNTNTNQNPAVTGNHCSCRGAYDPPGRHRNLRRGDLAPPSRHVAADDINTFIGTALCMTFFAVTGRRPRSDSVVTV